MITPESRSASEYKFSNLYAFTDAFFDGESYGWETDIRRHLGFRNKTINFGAPNYEDYGAEFQPRITVMDRIYIVGVYPARLLGRLSVATQGPKNLNLPLISMKRDAQIKYEAFRVTTGQMSGYFAGLDIYPNESGDGLDYQTFGTHIRTVDFFKAQLAGHEDPTDSDLLAAIMLAKVAQ